MNPRPDFKKSVKEFYDAVSAVENATDPSTLSALERAGVGKMRTLQTAASYVGYDLRAAVEKAKARFRENLGKPVEKPVENSMDEKEFARLKKLLKKVSTLYPSGSTLRHKETNKEYRMGFQMTVTPYGKNKQYGIAVTVLKDGAEKEELTFKNDEVNTLLTDYEPVENSEQRVGKPKGRPKKTTKSTKKEK